MMSVVREENKKSLVVEVTNKEIPDHFLKGFEARNAKEKEQCVRAAMEKNRREFRDYFRRLCISCTECMRDKKKTSEFLKIDYGS